MMIPYNAPAMLTIVTLCGETRSPLPGARYTITNRARQKAIKTTCEKGIIRLAGLRNGIYRLEECRPAAGYRTDSSIHRIAVCNGRVVVNGKRTRELRLISMPLLPSLNQAPAIHPIYVEDVVIAGAGKTGQRITVTFPNGQQAEAVVQQNNAWRVSVPPNACLSPGEMITASQKSDNSPGGVCALWSANHIAAAVVIDGPTATVTGTVFPVAFDPELCGISSRNDSAWKRGAIYLEANATVASLRTLEGYEVQRTRAESIGFSGEGKFSFEGVPAGQYVMHIQRPGFLPSAQLIQVKSGAARAKHECAAIRLTAIKPAIMYPLSLRD